MMKLLEYFQMAEESRKQIQKSIMLQQIIAECSFGTFKRPLKISFMVFQKYFQQQKYQKFIKLPGQLNLNLKLKAQKMNYKKMFFVQKTSYQQKLQRSCHLSQILFQKNYFEKRSFKNFNFMLQNLQLPGLFQIDCLED